MKFGTATLLGLAVGLALLPPAAAHHSVAMFDATKTVQITGVVDHYEWTNPHAWVWVAVAQPGGGKKIWGFECASLGMLRRMGFTRETFKPGDHVTITGAPLSSGQPGGSFRNARFADGHVVGFGGGGPR